MIHSYLPLQFCRWLLLSQHYTTDPVVKGCSLTRIFLEKIVPKYSLLSLAHLSSNTTSILQWMMTGWHPLNVRNWIIAHWSTLHGFGLTLDTVEWYSTEPMHVRRTNMCSLVHWSMLITLAVRIKICVEKNVTIRSTIFRQHLRRIYAWTSPTS